MVFPVQKLQVEDDDEPAKNPGRQETQPAAPALEYLPATQLCAVAVPDRGAYRPAVALEQVVAPALKVTRPASQREQEERPSTWL